MGNHNEQTLADMIASADAETLNQAGNAFSDRGMWQEALACYERHAADPAVGVSSRYRMAILYGRRGYRQEAGLLLAIVYLPPLQRVFGTAPIPLEGWLCLLPWAPAPLLADEARKAIVRRREKKRPNGGAP